MHKSYKLGIILVIILSILGCQQGNDDTLIGYIEGEYTYVASSANGTLFELPVERGQSIEIGDLLFKLDPQPDEDARDAASAALSEAKAQLTYTEAQYGRQKLLYEQRTTDRSALDLAESEFKSKKEEVTAAAERLAQAEWILQQKSIHAPVSGKIFDVFYRVGEKVAANQPVVALIAPENIKVLFYLPEENLSQIKLGQRIFFNCDSCQKEQVAHISYISPEAEFTPPVIYSEKARDKLVYLIRADIESQLALKFHPGQPVDVLLHE